MNKTYQHFIPSNFYSGNIKLSQIVPEQMINQTVKIYKDALDYIKCEIKSTIQHEAGHREDEQHRNQDIINSKETMPFKQYSDKGRTEYIAEEKEENCDMYKPQKISNETVSVNLHQLFEEAKASANIDPMYKQDVKAGTLDPEAQGQYLMQDLPKELIIKNKTKPYLYEGFDGSLWVDVRKIVEPYIVSKNFQTEQKDTQPSTFQSDGMLADLPGVSRIPPKTNIVPPVPSVPSIGAR